MNKRLLKEANNKKLFIPLIFLHSLLNSIFIILNAYILALIVNDIFIKHENIVHLKSYFSYFLLNAAAKSGFNFSIDSIIKKLSEDIKENIKLSTLKLIINSNAQKVKDQNTGELLNTLTDSSDTLFFYYSQYIPQIFASVLIPIIICIFVVYKDSISALIMLITYPIIPLFMSLIGYKSKEKNQEQWETLTTLSSHFLDMLQGLKTLKAFGRSNIQTEKVYEVSENYRKSTIEVLKISFLSTLVLETSATISTAIVAVNLGLRLVYSKIDFFTAFFVLVITPEFYIPLRQLGVRFHASLNGQVAIEKIEALENILIQTENKPTDALFKENELRIQIKQLSFSHMKQEALHNLSLKIGPKETVAIIGESGSGKSTFINILAGFLTPADNTVFINNMDLNYLDKTTYINKIALVPQFPHIFNMSLRDNILLGNIITEDEFSNICKITRINDFAEKFNQGYNTLIGEGEEVNISGGEKQRIALARALIKKAEIIILDEPTSALDSDTEELITEVFNTSLKDKTVIIAAHRLNTIRSVDRIFVLKKGILIESGTPSELILKDGKYFNLSKTVKK